MPVPGLERAPEMIPIAVGISVALVAIGIRLVSNRISKLIRSINAQELKETDERCQTIIQTNSTFQANVQRHGYIPPGSVGSDGKVKGE